ncbi:SGNH/GDSL hydrolase family protein [Leifsonia sp. A12D58]|uniref:SGNH/GDSL hydrolase family protein n=1 Tax=Leifsonia sp. A12D58 TaxID=3397674 RepID=UPI0039E008CE
MTEQLHPWSRYVALGDSFTEGIGDAEPSSPGGHRGWADRVAEVLSQGNDDFSYANLAVRGKLIRQIVDEQIEPALALHPDLITISAGGNDVIRPGTDPDQIAAQFDSAIARLAADGATVVIFTGTDVGFSPVFRGIRGKVAIYNENVRAIAARYDCIVADQWALTEIQDPRMWAPDRLHLNPLGHHTVARMVLAALNVPNSLEPQRPEPLPAASWRQARTGDLAWAREYLMPWVVRRIRHQSSGDHVLPKRPDAGPFAAGGGYVDPRLDLPPAPTAPDTPDER